MKAKLRDPISVNNPVGIGNLIWLIQLKSTTKWKSHLEIFLEKLKFIIQ